MLSVRVVPAAQHLDLVRALPAASFLQTPAWAAVKSEWESESLGWFEGEELVGAGLVLYRQLPRVRRYLAYLPEGPLLAGDGGWDGDLGRWLDPLARHVRARGAFGIRMGPPVVTRPITDAVTSQRSQMAITASRCAGSTMASSR